MATFNKFNSFVQALGEKKHDLSNDQLVVALTNSEPQATNSFLGDITEIDYANLTSRNLTTLSWSNTSGVSSLGIEALEISATGSAPAFQYVVIYNDTASNDELVGWYGIGEVLELESGDKFNIVFLDSNKILDIV